MRCGFYVLLKLIITGCTFEVLKLMLPVMFIRATLMRCGLQQCGPNI